MRPLTINFIMPRATLRGGVKSSRLIAEALHRRGHRVTIAYVATPAPWPSIAQPRKLLRHAAREISRRGRHAHHLERSTAELLPVHHLPIRASDVPDADIAIATWWETVEWMRDWPDSKGVKFHYVRGFDRAGGSPQRVAAAHRAPFRRITISSALKRFLREEYGDDSAVVIPNGVDWSQFQSQPRDRGRPPTVGFMYSAEDWKDSTTAFAAARLAREAIPDLRVISFGATPIEARHGPCDRLEFHLQPAQHDIPAIYRRADCWIMSSKEEGFGMPGLEAAACHCPVVTTRCGGPEDYVNDGVNGYVVPMGDATAMAHAVVRVLAAPHDEWFRMSAASHTIAHTFDWDRSAERLEHLFHEAIAAARGETRTA